MFLSAILGLGSALKPGKIQKVVMSSRILLSRSSLEPLISLDLVGTKLYCFRARVHCYHCLYIIFSTNPVRRSEELRGGPVRGATEKPIQVVFRAGLEPGTAGLRVQHADHSTTLPPDVGALT